MNQINHFKDNPPQGYYQFSTDADWRRVAASLVHNYNNQALNAYCLNNAPPATLTQPQATDIVKVLAVLLYRSIQYQYFPRRKTYAVTSLKWVSDSVSKFSYWVTTDQGNKIQQQLKNPSQQNYPNGTKILTKRALDEMLTLMGVHFVWNKRIPAKSHYVTDSQTPPNANNIVESAYKWTSANGPLVTQVGQDNPKFEYKQNNVQNDRRTAMIPGRQNKKDTNEVSITQRNIDNQRAIPLITLEQPNDSNVLEVVNNVLFILICELGKGYSIVDVPSVPLIASQARKSSRKRKPLDKGAPPPPPPPPPAPAPAPAPAPPPLPPPVLPLPPPVLPLLPPVPPPLPPVPPPVPPPLPPPVPPPAAPSSLNSVLEYIQNTCGYQLQDIDIKKDKASVDYLYKNIVCNKVTAKLC